MELIGAAALPVAAGLILMYGFIKEVDVFAAFVSGAGEGIKTSLKLLPTLIGLVMAVTLLRESGLLDITASLLAPLCEAVGISPEILPLAVLRPVSGSGAMAYTVGLLEEFGPDSETGRLASVLACASETTFYAVTVYFSVCGCKKLYYTVPVALLGDFTAFFLSVLSIRFFG